MESLEKKRPERKVQSKQEHSAYFQESLNGMLYMYISKS